MSQVDFSYYEVNFSRGPLGNEICINGEIKNNSAISYSMAVFRVILYIQNKVVGSGIMKVAGLPAKGTRNFEAMVEGMSEVDERLIFKISRYEILFETGY
jgi:hypothetical protein